MTTPAADGPVWRDRGAIIAQQQTRIAELEAALTRVRALGDAFADDGLARYGGNIAWHIEEAIANEKGDFPDAADRHIASQRARAEAAEAELAALRGRIEALRSALERTESNFRLAVNGKPVRDMAETLAENRAALAVAPAEDATTAAPHAEDGDRCTSCGNGFDSPPCCEGDFHTAMHPPMIRPAPVADPSGDTEGGQA